MPVTLKHPIVCWLLLTWTLPGQADIYAFVDSNGVRHISNVPTDSRYKLVMKTPAYKKPAPAAPATPAAAIATTAEPVAAQSATIDQIALAKSSSGWKFVTPKGTSYISWSNGGGVFRDTGKPFSVNDNNRALYSAHIQAIATQYRLEPALLHAVISAESAYNPNAVSRAGAQGLMQLMPATAARFGVSNPFDPVSNMHGGAKYLRFLLDKFDNTNLAVAAYNAGEGAVARYGNQIPPFKETQTYVSRVLQFYNHYRSVN